MSSQGRFSLVSSQGRFLRVSSQRRFSRVSSQGRFLRVLSSDVVGTVPMSWPGYSKLRLRLRQKPYESRDVVNGINAVTGVTDVIVY